MLVAVNWLRVPQAPGGLAAVAKLTVSPETRTPVAVETSAVTVVVLVPLAGKLSGTAETKTLLGGMNCGTTVEPLLAESASVAVMVQDPAAIEAV